MQSNYVCTYATPSVPSESQQIRFRLDLGVRLCTCTRLIRLAASLRLITNTIVCLYVCSGMYTPKMHFDDPLVLLSPLLDTPQIDYMADNARHVLQRRDG